MISQSRAMALGRVLLYFFLLNRLHNTRALSLDLEGLKDQALSQITGPKLMDIVSAPPAVLAWRSYKSFIVTSDPRTCEK